MMIPDSGRLDVDLYQILYIYVYTLFILPIPVATDRHPKMSVVDHVVSILYYSFSLS